jgi:vacuolar-type H+-ATPase subunit F/Vma7
VSGIVAIGEELLLAGYALAGVDVLPAEDAAAARAAWEALPADTGLVLLTRSAYAEVGRDVRGRRVLWAVLPP